MLTSVQSADVAPEVNLRGGLQHRACCMRHGWSWVRAPNLHQCLHTRLKVCGLKRLGCHVDLCTVSRCCTRGESQEFIACRRQKHASEGSNLALKPRGYVTRSPRLGYQWSHEKDLCPPKIKKKNSQPSTHSSLTPLVGCCHYSLQLTTIPLISCR